ncbi:DUF6232 family protein [Caballeronia grimmiae]|uniref:QacE n=1 Tax=Caballeronia grimmiae TaxID=1071679 RepID=A0A069P2S9_9BURK|nr:DUF6232 family protein [Caballeronia grimmiae]KDR34742.1 QacE [Caballeronia grimmiae]GGD63145.1 hypothetical protein GCM10010985_16560 [Caballeronia grimmiae]
MSDIQEPTFGTSAPRGTAEERIFLDEGAIKVTNARLLVPGNTFAMSGITSVKHIEKDRSWLAGTILVAVGVILLFCGLTFVPMAVIALIPGAILLARGKPKYAISLMTSSGEVTAFSSQDKGLVRRVVDALNNAIVYRG